MAWAVKQQDFNEVADTGDHSELFWHQCRGKKATIRRALNESIVCFTSHRWVTSLECIQDRYLKICQYHYKILSSAHPNRPSWAHKSVCAHPRSLTKHWVVFKSLLLPSHQWTPVWAGTILGLERSSCIDRAHIFSSILNGSHTDSLTSSWTYLRFYVLY